MKTCRISYENTSRTGVRILPIIPIYLYQSYEKKEKNNPGRDDYVQLPSGRKA